MKLGTEAEALKKKLDFARNIMSQMELDLRCLYAALKDELGEEKAHEVLEKADRLRNDILSAAETESQAE